MYDFANSGYTTVVLTAIFNAYFVAVVAGNAPWATFAWTAALSLSYAVVIVTAPVIGAYADLRANKKRLLLFTTAGCVLGTAALAFAGPGDLAIAVTCVVISNFFFCTGCDLIAAFLPELARGRDMGKVSGWGWSLGYIGGLTTLGACLAYVSWAQAAGHTSAQFVPVTMLITAALFALASLPTFAILRERASPQPLAQGASLLAAAFARLAGTLRHAALYQDLRRFLWCIVFYQAGVQTVITLAAIYAEQAMGFNTRDTLVLVLVVNVTAAAGGIFPRQCAGSHRPRPDHRVHPRRLDRDRADCVGGRYATVVLDRRQPRRAVLGRVAVGRARAGGLFEPQVPPRRVLRLVGLGDQPVFHPWPHHLWRGELGIARQPPPRHADHRRLLCGRTADSAWGRRAPRPACRAEERVGVRLGGLRKLGRGHARAYGIAVAPQEFGVAVAFVI